jgi:hypothetical protein
MGVKLGSVSLRKKHRLKVFESREVRRIFGARRDEVTGDWVKLHKEELLSVYSYLSVIRIFVASRMRWAGYVALMGEEEEEEEECL